MLCANEAPTFFHQGRGSDEQGSHVLGLSPELACAGADQPVIVSISAEVEHPVGGALGLLLPVKEVLPFVERSAGQKVQLIWLRSSAIYKDLVLVCLLPV